MRRRVWLALLAVLLQVVAPLVPMQRDAAPWINAALCHDPGPSGNTPEGKRDPAPPQTPPCTICLTLHWIAAAAPPLPPVVIRPGFVVIAAPLPAVPTDRAFDVHTRPRIRAPPNAA